MITDEEIKFIKKLYKEKNDIRMGLWEHVKIQSIKAFQ